MTADDIIVTANQIKRAKLVASILTDHGHPVTPPDEGDLDDEALERWEVCVEIVKTLDGDET